MEVSRSVLSPIQRERAVLGLVMTCFNVILHRHSGEEDLVTGLLCSGRIRHEFRRCLGPLQEHLVLRTDANCEMSFLTLARAVFSSLANALAHDEIPFDVLTRKVQSVLSRTDLKSNHSPAFRVRFGSATEVLGDFDGANSLSRVLLTSATSPYDLTVLVNNRHRSTVEITVTHPTDIFTNDRISELESQLMLVLQTVASSATVQQMRQNEISAPFAALDKINIVDIELRTPRALKQLPVPSQGVDSSFHGSVAEALMRNAKAHPHRLAVSYVDASLTYEELDNASSRLANVMRYQGVQAGDCVAIYGHRSPIVVIAILGALKASASYTMVDPIYPNERIFACMEVRCFELIFFVPC